MQFLHGLAPRFETLWTVLGDTVPPSASLVARSRLEQAEYGMSMCTGDEGTTALTITSGGSCGSGGPSGARPDRGGVRALVRSARGTPRTPAGSCGRTSHGNHGHGHGRGRGHNSRGCGDYGGRGYQQQPASPWTGYFAPFSIAMSSL